MFNLIGKPTINCWLVHGKLLKPIVVSGTDIKCTEMDYGYCASLDLNVVQSVLGLNGDKEISELGFLMPH